MNTSDIVANLKERYRNPLPFSYLVAWICFNWEVTVALAWYDKYQIQQEGFKSIFAFITDKLKRSDSFLIPLAIASGYTFIYPILKNIIQAFYSWTLRWGNDWNIKILKDGKVPMDKFLSIRETLKSRTNVLEQIIVEENAYKDKYQELETKLLEREMELSAVRNNNLELSNFRQQLYDIRFLEGKWRCSYTLLNGATGTEDIIINNERYYVFSEYGERKEKFKITNYYYDNKSMSLFFIKSNLDPKFPEIVLNPNFLRRENDNYLVGMENTTKRIEYKRLE